MTYLADSLPYCCFGPGSKLNALTARSLKYDVSALTDLTRSNNNANEY